MTDILSLASRRKIHDFVDAHSGSHLREIARRCGLPLGTTLYHLDRLEAAGVLVVRRDGRYKRYFLSEGLGRKDRDLLSSFRHAVPRRVATVLLDAVPRTQRELCAAVGVSRSTLSFHVKSMMGREIVRREPARPENKYLLEDVEACRAILTRYRESLGDVSPLQAAPPAATPSTPMLATEA